MRAPGTFARAEQGVDLHLFLDIRMLCTAITTADQWLWSFIISRTTPYMITSLGYGTYMFFGALMIVMGFWALFFIPETKGECKFPTPSKQTQDKMLLTQCRAYA